MKDETKGFFHKDLKGNDILYKRNLLIQCSMGNKLQKIDSFDFFKLNTILLHYFDIFYNSHFFRQMPDDVTLDRFLIMSS